MIQKLTQLYDQAEFQARVLPLKGLAWSNHVETKFTVITDTYLIRISNEKFLLNPDWRLHGFCTVPCVGCSFIVYEINEVRSRTFWFQLIEFICWT